MRRKWKVKKWGWRAQWEIRKKRMPKRNETRINGEVQWKQIRDQRSSEKRYGMTKNRKMRTELTEKRIKEEQQATSEKREVNNEENMMMKWEANQQQNQLETKVKRNFVETSWNANKISFSQLNSCLAVC